MTESDTVTTQLSGSGRGAIATVVVDGPLAMEYISLFFEPTAPCRISELRENQTYFGTWSWRNYAEELVICRTARDQIEVHCHGGRAAARNILDSLISAGAREISSTAWLERSEQDFFVRQAKQMLLAAKTDRALAILLEQVRGAMRKHLNEVQELVRAGQLDEANSRLRRLVDFASLGSHLTTPWSVVVMGTPNTGKSSLINAVVGFDRAVVFDQPGTTRDVVSASTAIDGWPILMTDTAGIRESDDLIEAEGIRRAKEVLSKADLVLSVHDLTRVGDDRIPLPNGPRTLDVGTKLDLVETADDQWDVLTSAVTGQGMAKLMELISKSLVPERPLPHDAVPLCQGTTDLLSECLQQVDRSNQDCALRLLAELLSR